MYTWDMNRLDYSHSLEQINGATGIVNKMIYDDEK